VKKLVAIILALREEAFIVACLRAIYGVVDRVVLISSYDQTLKGDAVAPDKTLELALNFPDPDKKLFILLTRHFMGEPSTTEDAMRNFAMRSQPDADYYLIVDADEIHERERLRRAWEIVAEEGPAWVRVPCYTYFKMWNYRVVSKDLCSPIVFLRRGYELVSERGFKAPRGGLRRMRVWIETGCFPRELRLSEEWAFHHGSFLGTDERILAKTQYGGYARQVREGWYERYWVGFDPKMRNFHPVREDDYYEGIEVVATEQLPREVRDQSWPEGWLL
jgi:hypothetical protein